MDGINEMQSARKLWFPCKYFTLNAASLTVIAVAMKLSMDLNNQSKEILESKYQAAHEAVLKDQDLQAGRLLSVEKLKRHVSNYWIMARTGSPQFMTACTATTSASGVICATSAAVRNDEELGKLLAGVTIAHGGVLPNINPILLPKKSLEKATKEPKSPAKSAKSPKKA
ncbi:hypothetical protein L2E82_05536 [Cichorium intybus]|uniref:Uncharacterized protein n=1 Tax=Cichorium intybus TaxID=13427 RepID=A0ACB9H935_CICIN|nr:hypothetical protein L2E82_05536 [Cichorium intybus]